MTKRQIPLEYIRIEVAREGKVTAEAIRHYIENRISRQAFQDAIELGMAQWSKTHAEYIAMDSKPKSNIPTITAEQAVSDIADVLTGKKTVREINESRRPK